MQELPTARGGVGVAIPGLVDGNRVQLSAVLPLLAGVTTEDFGKGRFPVTFLNDVKAAVLAEAAQYPAGKNGRRYHVGDGDCPGCMSEPNPL